MKWLILRGLVREQRHWGEFKIKFEQVLKTIDPNAEVFCLDAPGFGTEASRYSPQSIAGIVKDMRARWLSLANQNQGTWNLLAISLGGMVAAEWCSRYPDDFKKLVLVNSSFKGLSPLYHRLQPHNFLKIISLLVSSDIERREQKILKMTTNLQPDQLIEKGKKQAEFALPVRKIDALSQIMAAARFQAPQKIKIPLLVIRGMGDTLVSPLCSEKIAKHYRADLISHPHANHDLSTDEPDWLAQEVARWVSFSG